MRLNARSRVDLPQPDGPMNAVISLRGIVIVTSFTAVKVPYFTPTSSSSKIEP